MPPLRTPVAQSPFWRDTLAAVLLLSFFAADVVLPSGATSAIGYSLIPVILGAGRPRLLLAVTVVCTMLTAVGYWVEPLGAQPFISVFDRSMVVGVLWLTFVLVTWRNRLFNALVEQTAGLQAVSDELRRSNMDLERFASTAAHDLRGPLGAVGLHAEVLSLSGSVQADTEALQLVGSIKSELRRMSELIQSLLAYGHAGAHELDASECDCSAVLSRVKQSIRAAIDAHGAAITIGPLPTIHADPTLIGRLFQNLIENGIKYRSEAPPAIQISASAQADRSWLFSVRDNGIGIRTEDCDRVFKPFCQIRNADSVTEGIGLGLATCKQIVERHGGRIWVTSNPGEGACFFFTLPQRPAPRRAANEGVKLQSVR
jgi:light-regulated signal transduction histidine kinase (bacteriophytochrome)